MSADNRTPIIPDNLELPDWAEELISKVEVPDWALPLVEPQCEPCPRMRTAYGDFVVRCETDFVVKPHPLALGGLIPLPPTCEPDGEKVRKVQAVADKAVEELREVRAKLNAASPSTRRASNWIPLWWMNKY